MTPKNKTEETGHGKNGKHRKSSKVQDTDEKELADTVEALLQIEKKNYQAVLLVKGIPGTRIRKYGFAFCGKKVLIGRA